MADSKRFISRRSLLTGAGATFVLVAGGGVWRAVDQGVFSAGEGPAYEPWQTWRTDEPKRILKLVRAAVLASNAHNAQPWLFHVTDSAIDVFADHQRNIGAVDPFLREMYMIERLERELQLKIEPHFGRKVEALVSDSSWQALFPFRMGYPKVEAKLSPRRPIQDVML